LQRQGPSALGKRKGPCVAKKHRKGMHGTMRAAEKSTSKRNFTGQTKKENSTGVGGEATGVKKRMVLEKEKDPCQEKKEGTHQDTGQEKREKRRKGEKASLKRKKKKGKIYRFLGTKKKKKKKKKKKNTHKKDLSDAHRSVFLGFSLNTCQGGGDTSDGVVGDDLPGVKGGHCGNLPAMGTTGGKLSSPTPHGGLSKRGGELPGTGCTQSHENDKYEWKYR